MMGFAALFPSYVLLGLIEICRMGRAQRNPSKMVYDASYSMK